VDRDDNDDAVESFAVWAYDYDDGALKNRYCVVVFDDVEDAEDARRWPAAFQNLFFLRPRDYLLKFWPSYMSAGPPPPPPPSLASSMSTRVLSPVPTSPPAIPSVNDSAFAATSTQSSNTFNSEYLGSSALNSSCQLSVNTSPLLNALRRSPHQANDVATLDVDISQRSVVAVLSPNPKKRSCTTLHRSPQLKWSRVTRHETPSLRRTFMCIKGAPVVNLDDVNLLVDGSVEVTVCWEKTTVTEIDIDDAALRECFKNMFKEKYGKEKWKRWVRANTARGRRYGRD
jgi:hypothetical protein